MKTMSNVYFNFSLLGMKTKLLQYLQTPKHESKNKIVVRGLVVRLMCRLYLRNDDEYLGEVK